MPVIQILPQHVANLIAAGEVVERPASAVKELMENSIDAGARNITVDIRRGGRTSIRITDDGCGMSPEDAGICFLRHATSKLRDERGLEAIGTLGFRGEALAAISGISRITLTTRARGAAMGVRLLVSAGEIEEMEEYGCPEGTTILVEDLYYNTPARQKFLGSDRAEGSACVQAALACALGHPEIAVRCRKDGSEEFFSPGDGVLSSAIYALLGRDFAAGLREMHGENEGVAVTGYISNPEACRGNRSGQHFYCNGRPFRSKTLQAALEQAYSHSAMIGKFPACVLNISLPNGLVDVNVHPTKAEVKFAREKTVYDAVYYGVLSALHPEQIHAIAGSEHTAPILESETKPRPTEDIKPAPVLSPSFSAHDTALPVKKTFSGTAHIPFSSSDTARWKPAPPSAFRHETTSSSAVISREERRTYVSADTALPEPPSSSATDKEPASVLDEDFSGLPFRMIGEALGVYILLEQGDNLILVDKHAAHERLLFDKMRLAEQPLMSQELLIPETLSTDPDGSALITENEAVLRKLGFTLESFGEDTFAIRGVPADTDPASAAPLLEELVEKLREGRSLSIDDIWERLAETVACKAAVKANMDISEKELFALAQRVMDGDVRFCPHGRPVLTVLTKKELDKRFSRIV